MSIIDSIQAHYAKRRQQRAQSELARMVARQHALMAPYRDRRAAALKGLGR